MRPRVVIVGGGFGGLWAAKTLKGKQVDVELIDRHNYHTFFPLLYQVAAAELQPSDIAYPIRGILKRTRNARFRLGEVTALDLDRKQIDITGALVDYDYLILAPGSTTQFFEVAGAETHGWPLRTLDQAIGLRNHILRCVEEAALLSDKTRRARLLTFTIVGGGPTGVEFAGALQELINGPLAREQGPHALAPAKVVLVEATGALLGSYPERLSRYANRRLASMGVEVLFESQVESVDPDGVDLAGGARVESATVVWVAGVRGESRLQQWNMETGNGQRVVVNPYLQLPKHPEAFVIGDSALLERNNPPLVAPNALQQGVTAARNVLRMIEDKPLEPYRYRDLGGMAVIGRNAAIAHLFNQIPLTGFLAWVVWLGLHLIKLVGFRNRVAAVLSWMGDYLFTDRVARQIIGSGTIK
jgi:NADH dehydrogenase